MYLNTLLMAVICMNKQCDYKGQEQAYRIPVFEKIACPECGFKTVVDARFSNQDELEVKG
jgi:DNA-directed RNA polymerase subunit RPC12/RpoP